MRYEKNRDTLVVYMTGELDQCSAQGIRRELDALLEDRRVRRLVMDMQDMTFMDSSGIGMMIGRYKFMKRRGGGVRVRGMRQPVERVFRMSGLGQIIKNEERTESK